LYCFSFSKITDFRRIEAAEHMGPPFRVGLAMFIVGLLVMNTAMTAPAVGLFRFSSRLPRFQFVVTAQTAIDSLAVGALFLFGSSGLLPPLG
jgi:hypothetical protein